MSQSNTDCYFFYYSSCSKGNSCQFRHEPAALNQETVCAFWKKGNCSKPHCMFRHMVLEKKRTVERCYWESQPTGCLKPHCPFLHEAIKEQQPYDPEKVVAITNQDASLVTAMATTAPVLSAAAVAPKIIVNRNKLDEIMQTTPNRMVILPAKPRQALKDRLGQRVIKEEIEIHDCSDPEEENLRQGAISTLDLRSRIRNSTKRKFSEEDEEESYSEPETKKVLSSVVKKVKKEKKEKKKKKDKDRESSSSKSKKRSKKSSPSGTGTGLAVKTLREITPTAKVLRQPRSLSVSSGGDDSGTEDTLAKRIAAQRQKDGPGKSRSSSAKKNRKQMSGERKKSKKTTSNLERSVEIVDRSDQDDSSAEYVSLKKTRKLKVPGSSSSKSGKSNADDKESVQSVIDDVDALLKSSDPALTSSKSLNDSLDVMKELDEFINS